MRRWYGWGDDAFQMELPSKGRQLLNEMLGEGRRQEEPSLQSMLRRVRDSRLPTHSMVSDDPFLRLNHAHGQSLPDWVALRGGSLEHFPDGVAQPVTLDDIRRILKYAESNNAVVIPYGGGTSVVGHLTVPQLSRPVLSLSLENYDRPLHIDADNLLATFEAGVKGPDLESHLNRKGLTLGHFPQSFEYSTLGGWVVTRSTGQYSRHYGRIEQLFAGGDILTPQGEIHLPPFPASAAGPDLREMLLGSEGRLGLLTQATVRVSRLPQEEHLSAVFFPTWPDAKAGVQALAGQGLPFAMLRLSNAIETMTNLALAGHERQIALLKAYLRLRHVPPATACMCLVGFIGTRRIVRAARQEAIAILRRHHGVSVGRAVGNAWKKNRFRSAYLRNTLWDLGYAVDTLETAVTWDKVTTTIQKIETALQQAADEPVLAFSHLSHVYASGSSIYTTFVFRLGETAQATLRTWDQLKRAASREIVEAGGTISHQHGIGSDHLSYVEAEKGPVGLKALQQFFAHLDPGRRMNPGKCIPEIDKIT